MDLGAIMVIEAYTYWNLQDMDVNLLLKTGPMFLEGSIMMCLEATIIISFLDTELIIILPRVSILMNIQAFLSSSAIAAKSSGLSEEEERFAIQSQNLMSTIDAFG